MTHKATLQVGSLVCVNNIVLRQFIDHGKHFGKSLLNFLLIITVPQIANGVTGSFVLVAIAFTLRSI